MIYQHTNTPETHDISTYRLQRLIQIQLIAITLVKLVIFTTFVINQTNYIHDICDTINIPSDSLHTLHLDMSIVNYIGDRPLSTSLSICAVQPQAGV